MKPRGKERRTRGILFPVMAIIALVVAVTATIFTLLLLHYRTQDAIALMDSRLFTAAELSREMLGTGYHDRIVDETSVPREEFSRIVARNDDLCRRLNLQYLWSVLLVDGRLVFTSATHSDLNDPHSPYAAFFETHRDPHAFASAMPPAQKPAFSSFDNEWGKGRQILIPRKDAHGRTYIFGASVQRAEMTAIIHKTVAASVGVWFAVFCGALLLALVLAHSVTRPIAHLAKAAGQIATGDFEVPMADVAIRELACLSDALTHMQLGLKQYMGKLRESEERLRLALAGADLGTWDWHVPSGKVTFNERWNTMLGYTLGELEFHVRTWESLLHPEDAPCVMNILNAHLEGKTASYECEHRLRHKSGSWVWVLDRGCVIERDAQGNPVRACGTHLDITEHKRAECALRESEERFRQIVERTSDVFYRQNAVTAELDYISPTVTSMLGYVPEELMVMEFEEQKTLFHPDDLPALLNFANELIEADSRGQTFVEREFRFLHKQGTYRWLHGNYTLIRDQQGTPHLIVGSLTDITARKQAEEALHIQHELLVTLGQAMGLEASLELCLSTAIRTSGMDCGAIYLLDKDTDTFRLAWHEGLPEQVLTDAARMGTHPEYVNTICAGRAVYANSSDFSEDGRRPHQQWQALAMIPIFYEGRAIACFNIASHTRNEVDAGARPLLESIAAQAGGFIARAMLYEALRESEEKHRTLMKGIPDIVARFDREGRHLFISDNIKALTDIPASAFIGKTPQDMAFPERLCNAWEEAIAGVFEREVPFETECTFQGKNGVFLFDWRLIPEFSLAGKLLSVLSISRDITAQRRAEEDYRTLFREMLEGFALHEIILDSEGNPVDFRFLAVNPAFERMTGLKADHVVGRNVLDVLPETERYWIETYGNVAITGEPAFFDKYHAGLRRYFEVTAFRPAPRQFACIFSDITRRKQAEEERSRLEEQLRQAQKMESVGRLAGGVAHDFNNMLGVILGHVELALTYVDPGQSLYADLEEIRHAAERSADLTRQLLAFARKQTVTPKVLDLNDTVAGMFKMLQRLIGEDIHLVWHPGAGLWPVKLDPSQVDQILANLCVNARDAIADVGNIVIETGNTTLDEAFCTNIPDAVPGEYVQLSVGDDGCGMEKSMLDRVFEPFFTTKDVGEGTGLGLATVYGAVRQNDGFIDAHSEPGKGTTFRIYLPRCLSETDKNHTEGTANDAIRGHETILLVEDELAVLRLATAMLQRHGYTVLPASSPKEAIRIAQERAGVIHLLVTDVVMPDMNGRDLATRLRASFPHLKCLYMSGYPAEVIAQHGILEKHVHFLQKPFTMRSLLSTLRETLDS